MSGSEFHFLTIEYVLKLHDMQLSSYFFGLASTLGPALKTALEPENLLETKGKIERDLFRNTLEPILGPKSAIYGWHGLVGSQIGSLPSYEFYLPKDQPVAGLDYVCVLKGRMDASLAAFVELLTDEESTIYIAKTRVF